MQQNSHDLSQPINKYRFFNFSDYSFDDKKGVATLSYRLENDGPAFNEVITFGPRTKSLTEDERICFDHALRLLHIAAGISYYKTYVPAQMQGAGLSEAEAIFFSQFYREGLGEFAHRNGLDLSDRAKFDGSDKIISAPALDLPPRRAVLIGGGKDSLVSLDILRQSGEEIVLFAVNPAKPIRDCIAVSGLPSIIVSRKIDERLFAENEAGAYNGHVPITGIISFIAAAASIWHGFDTIILSNERSANEATVDGVNHQYSKSQKFESAFAELIGQSITPTLSYFSFLRPFSEIGIAQFFAKIDHRYDGVFTSCNKAYSVTKPMLDQRWCGECPKCHFVFLVLATAIDKERLIDIFDKNLLNSADNIEGYKNLTGLAGQKPWECVGEILESASALYHLSQDARWKDDTVITSLIEGLVSQYGEATLQAEYERAKAMSDEHAVPLAFMEIVKRHAA